MDMIVNGPERRQVPPLAILLRQDGDWVILHEQHTLTPPDRQDGWRSQRAAEQAAADAGLTPHGSVWERAPGPVSMWTPAGERPPVIPTYVVYTARPL